MKTRYERLPTLLRFGLGLGLGLGLYVTAFAAPKAAVSAEDLVACKAELAEFHRLEINFFKQQTSEYCTNASKAYSKNNCQSVNKTIQETSSKSNLAWFIEGNSSCQLSDYPCFGLDTYNGDNGMPENVIREIATGIYLKDLPKVAPSLWEYASVVDHCIAKIWVAKVDRNKPASPSAATASPAGDKKPTLSAQQIAACSADIKRTQIASQKWTGSVDEIAVRLGRSQKALFEGRCAGHPETVAYIATANRMIGYEGAAAGTGAPSGAAPARAAPSAASERDTSRQRKVHNPAADARLCVKLIQDSTRQGAGTSGNWRFGNDCSSTVEIFWCFVQDDGRCRDGGTWTVHAGKGWPTFDSQAIKWGACRGSNGGGFDRDSNGDKYTCELLTW